MGDSRPTLWEINRYFLILGATGFGGPVALANYMRRDLAERRHWLTDEEYDRGLAIATACPGPLAYQLGVYCGYITHGVLGGVLVALSFAFAPFVLVTAAAMIYVHYAASDSIRGLFIFLTFSVILVTLVGGGLTLPSVVRGLKIPPGDDEEAEEMRTALTAMSRSALERLHALEREGRITAADTATLARHYASRRRLPGAPVDREEQRRLAAEREVLLAERTALVKLRNDGGIDNTVLRRIVRSLDIAEEAIPAEDSPLLPE